MAEKQKWYEFRIKMGPWRVLPNWEYPTHEKALKRFVECVEKEREGVAKSG